MITLPTDFESLYYWWSSYLIQNKPTSLQTTDHSIQNGKQMTALKLKMWPCPTKWKIPKKNSSNKSRPAAMLNDTHYRHKIPSQSPLHETESQYSTNCHNPTKDHSYLQGFPQPKMPTASNKIHEEQAKN